MNIDPISIINLADEYKNLTVVKLKEECKKKNIRIPFKSSKDNIIALLANYNPSNDLNNLTVEQLRQKCNENNIKNCSRLKKDDLINKLSSSKVDETHDEDEKTIETHDEEKTIENMSFFELKKECKKRDIKNYSKLKKVQLLTLLTTGEFPSNEETENKSSSDTEQNLNTQETTEQNLNTQETTEDEKTIENMSFFELKKECKKRDIKNYSKLKKVQLLTLLTTGEYPPNEDTENKSSSDTEQNLNAEVDSGEKTIETMSLTELKKECKKRNIKNFSKLNKEQLQVLLTTGLLPESSDTEQKETSQVDVEVKTLDNMTLSELKKECKNRELKNYSKLNKEQLQVLLTTGVIDNN